MRVLGAFAAGLILLLTIGAQSPDLHAWLHGEETAHGESATPCADHGHEAASSHADDVAADDGCAITLFSNGIVAAVTALTILQHLDSVQVTDSVAHDRVPLTSSVHLRPQPQAPPAGC